MEPDDDRQALREHRDYARTRRYEALLEPDEGQPATLEGMTDEEALSLLED